MSVHCGSIAGMNSDWYFLVLPKRKYGVDIKLTYTLPTCYINVP